MINIMELKIMNMKQVAFYVSKGLQPKRIELGHKGKIIFVYTKEETNDAFSEWLDLCKEYRDKFIGF